MMKCPHCGFVFEPDEEDLEEALKNIPLIVEHDASGK